MPGPNIYHIINEEATRLLEEAGGPGLVRPALVEPRGRSVSYAELFSWVDELAAALSSQGVSEFSRVGLVLNNSPEYVALSLAVLSLNAAIVPVSPEHTAQEVADVMGQIGVAHVLYREGGPYKGQNPLKMDKAPGVVLARTGHEANIMPKGPKGYNEITPAFIRFSSGTTGQSKGVVLSHVAIDERTEAADAGLDITSSDNVLWVLSMSFHFVVTILLFLRRGAGIIICHEPFPASFIEGIMSYGGNVAYAAPFHYDMLSTSPDVESGDIKGLRLAVSTTVKLPEAVAENYEKKFGLSLTEAYGIIEVGLPFVGIRQRGADGSTSLGRPLPAYEVRIDVPDSEGVGEILLKGPGMLDAYYEPWRMRAEALDHGWFRTGDLGRLGHEGQLYIVGRKKSVINFSGMKVFPSEVEEVIDSFPGVRESMVYPEEHARLGQLPMASIVPEDPASPPDMRELRRYCYERLAQYKTPKGFELVGELPRTKSGKLKRG